MFDFLAGGRAYLPKECLTPKPKVSDKVDIYSYGMLLLEMVTGWCATDEYFPGVPRFKELVIIKHILFFLIFETLPDQCIFTHLLLEIN